MRTILSIFLLVLINSNLFSQISYPEISDNNIDLLSMDKNNSMIHRERDFFDIPSKESYEIFIRSHNLSGFTGIEDFNFEDRSLIFLNYSGVDCHSRFKIELLKNDDNNIFDLIVGIISGGCRAGGRWYSSWISIPKLPLGYELRSTRIIINNESEILK